MIDDVAINIISHIKLRQYYRKNIGRDLFYLPSSDSRVKTMLKLSGVKPGQKTADLGSGDGKIVLAFALAGAKAYGVEIDKTLSELSEIKLRIKKLTGKGTIINGDFLKVPLGSYDIITVYGLGSIMKDIELKIRKEAKKGCRILCNYFKFPDWKPTKTEDNIYVYIKD
jgi:ubiquinone/menaquinone biosynthesis C-methylase UbiE